MRLGRMSLVESLGWEEGAGVPFTRTSSLSSAPMSRSHLAWLALVALVPLSACGTTSENSKSENSKSDESEEDDTPKKKKKKKKSDGEKGSSKEADPDKEADKPVAKTAEPTSVAPTTTAPVDTPPVMTGVAPSPGGRSPVPTLDEWSGVGEVTVLGSAKFDCETKLVREWVRVTCKGNARERGQPTGVTITRGGGKGDTFTFASGGVASLIYPFYEGQNLEASFVWQRQRKSFKAEWPRGAPKPTAYGIFEGGDAHLKK